MSAYGSRSCAVLPNCRRRKCVWAEGISSPSPACSRAWSMAEASGPDPSDGLAASSAALHGADGGEGEAHHAGIPHLHTPAEVTVGLEAEVERLAAPAAEAAAVCTLSGTAFAAAALRPSLRKSGLMMQRVPQAGPLQCQGALEAGSGRQTPPETQSTSAGQAWPRPKGRAGCHGLVAGASGRGAKAENMDNSGSGTTRLMAVDEFAFVARHVSDGVSDAHACAAALCLDGYALHEEYTCNDHGGRVSRRDLEQMMVSTNARATTT
eukprot:CAMPEP_0206039090 /NCGR_PEP_ID=MMETSP1466-20131121/4521_1 /ASSEMBLY_ACC=CAM_ASM_001126 /TAXON_ID=44452 /ORGANISM="Pavlova gyrans, Strain CCMP608" /LENGTH=265 /DNA_ID=CAMNT_0053413709 /DNA_START=59 /DNA_END=859 /DNA_ORIENTATION=-